MFVKPAGFGFGFIRTSFVEAEMIHIQVFSFFLFTENEYVFTISHIQVNLKISKKFHISVLITASFFINF